MNSTLRVFVLVTLAIAIVLATIVAGLAFLFIAATSATDPDEQTFRTVLVLLGLAAIPVALIWAWIALFRSTAA